MIYETIPESFPIKETTKENFFQLYVKDVNICKHDRFIKLKKNAASPEENSQHKRMWKIESTYLI